MQHFLLLIINLGSGDPFMDPPKFGADTRLQERVEIVQFEYSEENKNYININNKTRKHDAWRIYLGALRILWNYLSLFKAVVCPLV